MVSRPNKTVETCACGGHAGVIPCGGRAAGSTGDDGRQVAQGSLFHGFRLDDHVPVDYLLWRVDALLDFGFVSEALAASYSAIRRRRSTWN